MKLVAYTRVSTDRQVEGQGLPVQRKAITAWAKANNHKIVRWCTDEGVSGTVDAVDREGLWCAIEAIESKAADGILVARLDRVARALTTQEAILGKVWSLGGAVFTADQGEVLRDDADDPMRTALRQMVGVFAQLERAMIAKRMRDGRRSKASSGGYAYGSPPLGTKSVDGALVVDEEEAAVVDRIREIRARGASFRGVVDVLTEEGWKTKRGGDWHPATVRKIVQRLEDQGPAAADARTTKTGTTKGKKK
jgi:DNA invertase Pin-like site-specific DNA recombinase